MHQLTKTDFLQYLSCPEELWLFKNIESSNVPPALDERHLMEQGQLIDELAKDFFTDHFSESFRERGLDMSFQKTAEANGCLARADVLAIDSASNTVDMYEVKASTCVKSEHIPDVAFQKMVFENSGWTVRKCFLVYINNAYQLEDELNLNALFVVEEITERVNIAYPEIRKQARKALQFINGPEPEKRWTLGCANKLQCSFVQHHYTELPEYSIFDISRIGVKKLEKLLENGILDVRDVPDDFKLTSRQKRQVEIARKNEVIVKKEALSQELKKLRYPLYFLDYETFAYAVPIQKGHTPFQQMLFQYSLHVVEAPQAEVRHFEYLLSSKEESVSELLASLKENIHPDKGTVLVWNKSFEQSRNKECAALFPEYADFLFSVNERVYDLMDIFKKEYYLHPAFKGKISLKSVLPVLCPELSYKTLPIQNGAEANINWHHWTDGAFHGEEHEFIKQALLEYCKLDTWAMVRIWQVLGSMKKG